MVVTRIKIPLDQAEYSALLTVSLAEMRSPSDQVRFILRQELERRGLLHTVEQDDRQGESAQDG